MGALLLHKYEGIGNDFVVVDAEREDALSPASARALCDRRFGVGGDGVLLVLPPVTPGAVARMRVINADGSVPEMCGNGLRCAVLHWARQRGKREGEIVFDTDAGLRPCILEDRDGQGLVTVDMGVIALQGEARIDLDGDVWALDLGDAGNPHAITTRPVTRAVIDAVGPRLATHPRFPAGTNVEFAAFHDAEGAIDLVVYERGVGVTLACGTGACATVAVAVKQGHFKVGQEVTVRLPGGPLFITIREDGRAIMRGPAKHVFSGELSEAMLAEVSPR